MSAQTAEPKAGSRSAVSWRLVLLLGAFALIRPLTKITGLVAEDGPIPPLAGTLGATALITAVWVAAVLQARSARPILTLILAGVTYAVLSTLLAGVLSPLLLGELQGPLAQPLALLPMLITNALWGAAAGLIALGLRAVFGRRAAGTEPGR